MKKPALGAALLTPGADGWRVHLGVGAPQGAKTLAEAAAAIPAGRQIHLALPAHAVLVERMTLPSTDRTELAGMLQLQLEKTLPYPIEEISNDFEVITQSENQSTLLSISANAAQLDTLCEPLRTSERLPEKITLYAMHVAASCPADQIVLCIWPEEANLELAICENGKLGFAQTFPGTDAELLMTELPQLLLSAEMEGVPTDFASIRVERGCEHLGEPLAQFFGKPVETVSFDTPLPEPAGNLVPPAWQSEAQQIERAVRLRQQLQLAAVVYLLLIAAAFIYLAWIKSRVQKLDDQIAETQPQIELVQTRQARWRALLPAIDPRRYPVEILLVLNENLPSKEVRLTVFDYSSTQFMAEGEGPLDLAIQFEEKLKAEKRLSDFTISAPAPPSIIPATGTSHFRYFGKL